MLDSDIKTYHAQEVSQAATNGGRRSDNQVISGVFNNVWPNIPRAKRLSGWTLYRKLFVQAAANGVETLIDAQHWIDRPTVGDDYVVAFVGTPTDTQADITGNERKYGAAFIKSDIAPGAQTFVVTVENAALATSPDMIFADGDTIRLTDIATPTSATGNEEMLTISGTPSVSGSDITITVAETIANGYAVADQARAISIIPKGDIKTSVTGFTVTSAGDGAYDSAANPLILDNDGTIEDSITLEFTDATHFTVTGTSGVNYGTGDTSTDFTPINSGRSKKYFTLAAAGFSGTWAAGDKIEFATHPADFAIWLRLTIPANCASLSNNKITTVTAGESNS